MKLELRKSIKGQGVFTLQDIKKGFKILEFKGKIFKRQELPFPYDKVKDHYVQITKNLYLGPSGDLDDFINHSCNPNSGIKIGGKKVFLISIKNIKKGQEITWDYSTTMDEDDWTMKCFCENKNCRKIIRDFKYIPKLIRDKYIKLGVVPDYVLR